MATFGRDINDRSEVYVQAGQPKCSADEGSVFGGFFGGSYLFGGRERLDYPTKAIHGSAFLVDAEHHLRAKDLPKSGEKFAHLHRRLNVSSEKANPAGADVLKQLKSLSVELRSGNPYEKQFT